MYLLSMAPPSAAPARYQPEARLCLSALVTPTMHTIQKNSSGASIVAMKPVA